MERKAKCMLSLLAGIVSVLFVAGSAWAYSFFTDIGHITLTGKAYSQASFRTEHSKGFTFPETDAWDLIQHRNFLKVEFKDKFNDYFSLYGSGRLVYDGLHAYGPKKFEPFADDEANPEFREGYLDITYQRLFFRIGRQNLSWGESDIFRLLDAINPLETTFGLFYEEFDERRQPLDMARLDLDLGSLGPFWSLTAEGFIASGSQQAYSTALVHGTPYAFPIPPIPVPVRNEKVDLTDARGGARILGVTKGVSWSVGHYWSYPDDPIPVFRYDRPADATSAFLEATWKRQATTGGSFSFFTGLQATQTVVRGEMAYVWNEAAFGPAKSTPIGTGTVFVPGVGYVNPGVPVPLPGETHDIGVGKWVLGLDNNIWVRALNQRNTFFVSVQAFGRHILDRYNDDIFYPASEFPTGAYVRQKRNEYTFTGLINTKYMNGNLIPEVAMAYSDAGVWYVQPSMKYRWGYWEGMVRYSAVTGNFYGIGFFNDRDQLSFRLTYYFR